MSRHNPCTGLELETPDGTFRASEVRRYGFGLTFVVRESVFEATGAGTPEHRMLPLTNFLSEFQQHGGELERHPLRIFPTPEVSAEYWRVEHGPDEEENERRSLRAAEILGAAYHKDQLIRFGFGEGLGFIERFPDYMERAKSLLECKERHKTTAVMVGPTGGGRTESFGAMRAWFPFDVLSLRTLASGSEVGSP